MSSFFLHIFKKALTFIYVFYSSMSRYRKTILSLFIF